LDHVGLLLYLYYTCLNKKRLSCERRFLGVVNR
jgi:hypothetical protein